jgi:hypothetical protein
MHKNEEVFDLNMISYLVNKQSESNFTKMLFKKVKHFIVRNDKFFVH